MTFFDIIGRRTSEAGQKMIQKTKDISDTTRYNSLISEEEKKINNQYYQIGKLYVALHAEDHEEEFAGMIDAIRESEEKMKEYKEEIQKIKGVRRCEKCGAEVPKDASFCSSCGAMMPVVQTVSTEGMIKCLNCGEMVKKGMRFCTSCGKPLETAPVSDEADEEENVIQEKICPSCGAKLEEDSLFCSECGMKI